VVTAKMPALAELHLRHLGLPYDELHGFAWADGKTAALRTAGATAYVGDHVADMAAARDAGVIGIGVTTGPCAAGELVVAGADVVLPDLWGLPPILARIQLGRGLSDS
jgi:phosphoglycolate phosphatase